MKSFREKNEIIRLVESSNLCIRKTLEQIAVSKSSFYESLGNITPRDKYFGREEEIFEVRRKTKQEKITAFVRII